MSVCKICGLPFESSISPRICNSCYMKQADVVFTTPSGAQSSHGAPRFDLIPLDALAAIAKRYEEGSKKYSDFNWMKGFGDPVFERDRYNHILHHLQLYNMQTKQHDTVHSEDDKIGNLAAAAWGCITLLSFELRRVREENNKTKI